MAMVDITTLQRLVGDSYLTCRKHPEGDLVVWNYTPKTQFERYWTPETLMCRGLITTSSGKIMARPFPKFFNLEEHEGPLPNETFEITEKLDGSLGVMYIAPDGLPAIATRGSFESEQAIHATHILRERYGDFSNTTDTNDYTWLFEIIYPANRIVVDYGEWDDLFLLAIIETETGRDIAWTENFAALFPFPVRKHFDGINDIAKIKQLGEDNQEGFVIRFTQSNLRLKIKLDEYKRLHRLITGINARHIWAVLSIGQPLDELLDRVPDEFYHWVKMTEATLWSEYHLIEGYCLEIADNVRHLPLRKEQAAIVTKTKYPGVVFQMLDGKDYAPAIWRLVRPEATLPFRSDSEL